MYIYKKEDIKEFSTIYNFKGDKLTITSIRYLYGKERYIMSLSSEKFSYSVYLSNGECLSSMMNDLGYAIPILEFFGPTYIETNLTEIG